MVDSRSRYLLNKIGDIAILTLVSTLLAIVLAFLIFVGAPVVSGRDPEGIPWGWLPILIASLIAMGAAWDLDGRHTNSRDFPLLRITACAGFGWLALWFASAPMATSWTIGSVWIVLCGVGGYAGRYLVSWGSGIPRGTET